MHWKDWSQLLKWYIFAQRRHLLEMYRVECGTLDLSELESYPGNCGFEKKSIPITQINQIICEIKEFHFKKVKHTNK